MGLRVCRFGLTLATVVLLGLAGAAGASASAGAPITIAANGVDPQVAVDSQGTAHVVWEEDGSEPDSGITEYCQIPAGGTACTDYQSFQTPWYGETRVLLGPTPGEIVLLQGGLNGRIYAWVSMDGGQTFSGGPNGSAGAVAGQLSQANLFPEEQAVFGPGAFSASVINAAGYFENFDLTSGPTPAAANAPPYPPAATTQDTQLFTSAQCGSSAPNSVTLLNDITPVAECQDQSTGTIYYRIATGQGNLNDASTGSWGPVEQVTGGVGGVVGAWLAGGSRGVYLLYNGPDGSADVSKLVNDAFGPPTVIAANTHVEGFSEDPTGNLYAVTQDDTYPTSGQMQRVFTSDDGTNWTEVPLDLAGVNQGTGPYAEISGCAAAGGMDTGSGFVVWSGGGLGQGAVEAESFGNSACGASTGTSSCPTHLVVGAAQLTATNGCFTEGSNGTYTTTDQVEMNGLMITPSAAGKLIVDTVNDTISSGGLPAVVKASYIELSDEPFDWLTPSAAGGTMSDLLKNGLPVSFTPSSLGSTLAGFAINGQVTPDLGTGGLASLPMNVQMPSPIGGFIGSAPTDDVTLTAGDSIPGGLSIGPGSINISIPDVSLGIASLSPFDISYDSDPNVFQGNIGLDLPGLSTGFSSQWEFEQGKFVYGMANVNFGMDFPIYTDVFLQGIDVEVTGERGNVCANPPNMANGPTSVGGGITFGVGPIINDTALFSVQGNASYTFPEASCKLPGVFSITGVGKVLGFPVANAYANFATNANIGVGASVGFGNHTLGIFANFQGGVGIHAPFPFYATGSAELYVAGIGFGPSITVSSIGIGGCLAPLGYAEYKWQSGFSAGPALVCGASDLIPQGMATSVRAADAPESITVPAHDSLEELELRSVSGVPLVSLTGPNGGRFTTPALAGKPGALMVTPSADSFSDLSDDTTVIKLIDPAAGSWRITPLAGSPPITALLTAHGLPAISVHANVIGHARFRYLVYRNVPAQGRTITFIESGAGNVMRPIATISGARGRVRFRPEFGPGGARTILAAVTDHGIANGAPFKVATYTAPAPQGLARPRRVRVKRVGSQIEITWHAVPGAARYVVRAMLADGRSLLYLEPPSARSQTVPAVPGFDAGTLMVAALNSFNQPGPIGTVTLKALAPTCLHPTAVRGKLVCKSKLSIKHKHHRRHKKRKKK